MNLIEWVRNWTIQRKIGMGIILSFIGIGMPYFLIGVNNYNFPYFGWMEWLKIIPLVGMMLFAIHPNP